MLQNRSRDRSGVPPRWRGRPLVPVLAVLAALSALIALGPRASVAPTWTEPALGPDLDDWLAEREAAVPRLRAGEAESVLWADSVGRGRTPLAVVYLHGFSADRHEVEPLVSDLASDLRANAYFARITGHGQDGQAMASASVEDWLADASEAVGIGARIGERVVLVGTSTGATLALWAAAQPEAAGRLAALVLISPNLGLRDRRSRMLLWPWGETLARLIVGPERCFEPENELQALHWTVCYPTRALMRMMALVEHVRSLDLAGVTVPTLVAYSRQDAVVDPESTERVLAGLGGRGAAYFLVPDSGDPAHHVIAGDIMSPGTTDAVRERILAFLESTSVR